MKKSVFLQIGVLIEVDEKELEKDYSYIDEVSWEIEDGINKVLDIKEEDSEFGWRSTSIIVLNETELNCGKCANCGTWTSDAAKENYISALGTGATVNGKLLCDDCLPKQHPYAF